MQPIELARRAAELGQKEDAQRAYTVALQEEGRTPMERFEAASYIFFSEGNYKTAFSTFVALYNEGEFQAELMNIIHQAFYQPNEAELRQRYADNCAALTAYPYCFRKDFPDFDDLPLRFVPFDDEGGYIPFHPAENRFGAYVNFREPVIDRYFFKDLENPILAKDVTSQYQLEYLNDTVRKSEWVGRENHIYLHYTDWAQFCAYLQCLELGPLLADEKFVFLAEDEIAQYPIDFKTRFGIDYSRYPVRPVGVREIHRLIWHTQLSTHNGGDFFNEIFYGHPNLIAFESLMFNNTVKAIAQFREKLRSHTVENMALLRQLAGIDNPTDKDILVAMFLSRPEMSGWLDKSARIAPIFFYQPHFENIHYRLDVSDRGDACACFSPEYEEIRKSPIFLGFKYIKSFSPVRRPTTSYAATVRYMIPQIGNPEKPIKIPDVLIQRILNESFYRDPDDRLFQDSILVRFEDGKLNPKATFTKLAEFLDIPYTESMTYCSSFRGVNVAAGEGNAAGFDSVTVYRTYDDYANDDERAFLEYFLRDLYGACGYDFHYYQGEPVDEAWAGRRIDGFTTINGYIRRSLEACAQIARDQGKAPAPEGTIDAYLEATQQNRRKIAGILLKEPKLITRGGQPMQMLPVLRPDPALLEQPLYR